MLEQIRMFIVENWDIILLIIQGVLGYVVLNQRTRLKNAEAAASTAEETAARAKSQAQRDLEQMRGENAETMTLLQLFGNQVSNLDKLATALSEQNKVLTLQGKQQSDALTLVVESNQLNAQTGREIATLITNFQSFSQSQHSETRQTVKETAETSMKDITKGLEKVSEELQQIRKGLNGQFKDLEPMLQRKFDQMEQRVLEAIAALKAAPPAPDIKPPAVNTDIGEDEDGKPDNLLDKTA